MVSGGDATEAFEPVEAALICVASAVGLPVECRWPAAAAAAVVSVRQRTAVSCPASVRQEQPADLNRRLRRNGRYVATA